MEPLTNKPIYLVFDVETTGLPRFPPRRPKGTFYPPHELAAYDSARLIEVAWKGFSRDGAKLCEFSTLVCPERPASFRMCPRAAEVHHISKADVRRKGIDTGEALAALAEHLHRYPNTVLVGHSIAYDWHVVASEAFRQGHMTLYDLMLAVPLRCTMHENTLRCGLRRENGLPKWPSLDELATHLFGKDRPVVQRHRALGDVTLTAHCFFETLTRIKVL